MSEQDVDAGDLSDELHGLIGGLGGSTAVIRVDRVREGGKSAEFVDEFGPEGFSLASLRDTYGGGEYLITVRDKGKYVVRNRRIAIAQPRAQSVPPVPPPRADLITMFREIMAETRRAIKDELAAVAPPQNSRAQFLDEARQIAEIFGGARAAPAPGLGVTDALDLIRTGMDFRRDMEGGGESWPAVIERIVEKVGPLVADTVAAARAQPSPRTHQQPAQHAAQKEGAKVVNPMVKHYLGTLIEQAQAGSDPDLWAALITERMTAEQIAQFRSGGLVNTLQGIDNRVKQYSDWFEELDRAVDRILNDDSSAPGGDPAGA